MAKYHTGHKFGAGKVSKRKHLQHLAVNRKVIAVIESGKNTSNSNVIVVRPIAEKKSVNTIPSKFGDIASTSVDSAIINDTVPKPSASQVKFNLFNTMANLIQDNEAPTPYPFNESDHNIIINFGQLQKIISKLNCSFCKTNNLTCKMLPEKRAGIVEYIYTFCSGCGEEDEAVASSPQLPSKGKQGRTEFLLNKRIVSAFLNDGHSYATLDHFCGAMNMPSMTHKTFDLHAESFKKAALQEFKNIQKQSVQHIKEAYKKINNEQPLNIFDICVSYDGSWRTRGHTSKHGVGIVIDVLTGLVIDYEILSNYCPTCDALLKRQELSDAEREDTKKKHGESGDCQINFRGSSNAMEAEAAVRIWSRSITNFNIRYTEILSDGDAKTYSKLLELNPYPGIQIKKDECVNHMQKRMGTALRKLVSDEKVKGVTLGGCGHGSLTNAVIDKLTIYYGKAIRDNKGDGEKMRMSVFSSFFHIISTDEDPHHDRCPTGATSWCFYNKALANDETPGSHRTAMKTFISKEVGEKMKEVYLRLGDKSLLERCTKGQTQNANEGLHSKIWTYCPKVGFSGRRLLDIGVIRAVTEFNAGAKTFSSTLELANIPVGKLSAFHSLKRDKQRLLQSVRRAKEQTKAARIARKQLRLRQQTLLNNQEGHLYVSGGGD